MEIEIDEKTLTETTLCECNFKCLRNGMDFCCKIENCNNALSISLKCNGSKYCQYKKFIGFSTHMCTCPTRLAVFKKNKI